MGKRKRSKSKDKEYEHILKKVKKLENKLKKKQRKVSSSSSENESVKSDLNQSEFDDIDFMHISDENEDENQSKIINPNENNTEYSVVVPEDQNEPPKDNIEPDLDPELLQILGEDPTKLNSHGNDLHKHIAPRWQHILTNGLAKDLKADLLKQYLIPANCTNLKAPKLNLEIKAALEEQNLKRDIFSENKQNQLSSCLSALGKVLDIGLRPCSTLSQDLIKPLSDASRLLCDYHYRESQSRRYAIMNTLNKQTRDTVKNTKIDEYLFGSELAEHLKSSKAISKSGSQMKVSNFPRPAFKPLPATQNQRGALNSRGTSRPAATETRQNTAARRAPAPQPAPRDRRRYDNPSTSSRGGYSRTRPRRR